MKKRRMRYLSKRVTCVLAAVEVLLLALLGFFCYICLRQGVLLWLCIILTVISLVVIIFGWRYLYKPYREVEKILTLFAAAYTFEGVFDLRYQHSPATESAIGHIKDLLSTSEWLNASKRQAQYLALQNQINPHFLYNTLDGIRGEALAEGSENIAMMTEALSTFFRYTISNLENLVTLEEELSNVKNYFLIQQYRFGKRLHLAIEFESEQDKTLLLMACLPKLTLQPIVENAIIHGLERKMGEGCVTIRILGTAKRLLIMVSDDGIGMPKEQLEEITWQLNSAYYDQVKREKEHKSGIAMANVNNRIRLLFGEKYGILIYSTQGQGTDVEITLPYITGEDIKETAVV